MTDITTTRRSPPKRCAFCHGDDGEIMPCSKCGAAHHDECRKGGCVVCGHRERRASAPSAGDELARAIVERNRRIQAFMGFVEQELDRMSPKDRREQLERDLESDRLRAQGERHRLVKRDFSDVWRILAGVAVFLWFACMVYAVLVGMFVEAA